MVWTDTSIKMGSEGLSGQILILLGVFHERDHERFLAVAEHIAIVVRTDLEGEAVPVHIDMDDFLVAHESMFAPGNSVRACCMR